MASLKDAIFAKVSDYLQLMKFRLLMLVIFTSSMSYIIVAGAESSLSIILRLCIGGMLVAGSANALNEIFEKDYDALMKRTKNRPLPAKRMTVSEAVVFAGISSISGIIMLYSINGIVAVLGALSLLSYAFVYTPLKRITPFSVFVGAIPGALPILIGGLAHSTDQLLLILLLFAVQFFWQFPHFWSIAWKGDAEYKRAGFFLLPSASGEKDKSVGKISFVYSLMLFPLIFGLKAYGGLSYLAFMLLILLCLHYSHHAFKLWKHCNDLAAKKLMYSSFIFLPVVMLVILIDIMI